MNEDLIRKLIQIHQNNCQLLLKRIMILKSEFLFKLKSNFCVWSLNHYFRHKTQYHTHYNYSKYFEELIIDWTTSLCFCYFIRKCCCQSLSNFEEIWNITTLNSSSVLFHSVLEGKNKHLFRLNWQLIEISTGFNYN